MTTINLTIKEAKNFLVSYQGLDRKTKGDKTNSIMEIFKRFGCIQYDPLNVVGRNPDLVLQSRIQGYIKQDLNHLLYTDRQLVDAWDKMMAIYPISDWPNFNRVRTIHGRGTIGTLKYRNSLDALDLTDAVKQKIIEEGPLQSTQFKSKSNNAGSWGHRKQSSEALDYLFAIGELGIWDKSSTQKVYDLIENIIPEDILNTPEPFDNDDDYIDWYVLRRINAIGLLWNKSGGGWLGYYTQKKVQRTKAISRLIDKNLITTVKIATINEEFYISNSSIPQLEEILKNIKTQTKQVRFIAPLDNFIWDRDLIEAIFNFKYRWEVYTPVKKREFGYYVLPILYGNDIVGRIEFDYYRGKENLAILNTWYEEGFKQTKSFEKAFQIELKNFERYLKKSL